MHRDLKKSCCHKPSNNFQAQQVRFNKFKKDYNENRLLESLEIQTPVSAHRKSIRVYKEEIKEWVYSDEYVVKYICRNGIIRVGKRGSIFIGSALKGKKEGLEPLENGIFRIYFREFFLGYVDWNNFQAYDLNDRRYVSELYDRS